MKNSFKDWSQSTDNQTQVNTDLLFLSMNDIKGTKKNCKYNPRTSEAWENNVGMFRYAFFNCCN